MGTTCRDLVHKLGWNPPSNANKLFNVATNFTFGKEAVGAIFDGEKGKRKVNHTLEECDMLRKYFNRLGHKDEAKKEKDEEGKGGDGYPSIENVFFIFGGPTVNMTARQHKRERREVFSVTKAMPFYLDWSRTRSPSAV